MMSSQYKSENNPFYSDLQKVVVGTPFPFKGSFFVRTGNGTITEVEDRPVSTDESFYNRGKGILFLDQEGNRHLTDLRIGDMFFCDRANCFMKVQKKMTSKNGRFYAECERAGILHERLLEQANFVPVGENLTIDTERTGTENIMISRMCELEASYRLNGPFVLNGKYFHIEDGGVKPITDAAVVFPAIEQGFDGNLCYLHGDSNYYAKSLQGDVIFNITDNKYYKVGKEEVTKVGYNKKPLYEIVDFDPIRMLAKNALDMSAFESMIEEQIKIDGTLGINTGRLKGPFKYAGNFYKSIGSPEHQPDDGTNPEFAGSVNFLPRRIGLSPNHPSYKECEPGDVVYDFKEDKFLLVTSDNTNKDYHGRRTHSYKKCIELKGYDPFHKMSHSDLVLRGLAGVEVKEMPQTPENPTLKQILERLDKIEKKEANNMALTGKETTTSTSLMASLGQAGAQAAKLGAANVMQRRLVGAVNNILVSKGVPKEILDHELCQGVLNVAAPLLLHLVCEKKMMSGVITDDLQNNIAELAQQQMVLEGARAMAPLMNEIIEAIVPAIAGATPKQLES